MTTDTWVTNHGYRDGAATARPAVLQAGTAVLVDTYGTPRAKCSCGNPLTPPPDNTNLDHTKTQGTPWPDYQPANVTTITPAPQPATDLTLTNIQTGTTYQQPVGTGGGATGTFVAAAGMLDDSGGLLYASADGKTWNQVFTTQSPVRAIVHGPDSWVALTATDEPSGGGTSRIVKSNDGQSWSDAGVVNTDTEVTTLAYGDGSWLATGTTLGEAGAPNHLYVYRSTDLTTWARIGEVDLAGLFGDPYPYPSSESLAYGNGQWTLLVLAVVGAHSEEYGLVSSHDGSSWQTVAPTRSTGAAALNKVVDPLESFFEGTVAFGGGTWVVAGTAGSLGNDKPHAAIAATSTDLSSWQATTVGSGDLEILAVSYGGDHQWYATANAQQKKVLYSSADGLSYQPAGDLPANTAFVIRG